MKTWVLAGLLLGGCTSANLFGEGRNNPPDRATFEGELCTDDPAERAFPVRILLITDTSIGDGDYLAQRADSIERLALSYSGANYSFAVVRYSGPLKGTTCGLRNLTPDGFTRTTEDAIAGLRCTDPQNPGRDVQSALSLASSFLTGDVLTMSRGLRSRTKYVVVLLSNGPATLSPSREWCNSRSPVIPEDECAAAFETRFCADVVPRPADCDREQYARIVRGMRDFALENGVQEFFFHAIYQRDPDDAQAGADDVRATELLRELTLQGGGSLYRFPGPGSCDTSTGDGAGCLYGSINFDSSESVFVRKRFIVSNRNALATARGLRPDSDGDGLADEVELELGTSAILADTDGDDLNDRLEHVLRGVGLDPLRHERDDPGGAWPIECPLPGGPSRNGFPPAQDRDGDGLRDCEEILLRSDPTLYDTDRDGVPDPLEFRYGTNVLIDDSQVDADNDGFANVDEFALHLDPLSRDPSVNRAYRYRFANEAVRQVVAVSQPFSITGLAVLAASDASREGRATVYYESPADPNQLASPENPAFLSYRDPQDTTPGSADPGRGARIPITGDGVYVLPSAESDPATDLSLTVEIYVDSLPTEPLRADVRLRRSERSCFDFRAFNVQLVDTLSTQDTRAGNNYIDLFFAEVPANNPRSLGVFRVASVPVFLEPAAERRAPLETIPLADPDFLLFGE